MPATLEAVSMLTDRDQNTVPEMGRNRLHLSKRDKVHYAIRPNGEVVLSRAEVSEAETLCWVSFWAFYPATFPSIQIACKPWMPASCNAYSR